MWHEPVTHQAIANADAGAGDPAEHDMHSRLAAAAAAARPGAPAVDAWQQPMCNSSSSPAALQEAATAKLGCLTTGISSAASKSAVKAILRAATAVSVTAQPRNAASSCAASQAASPDRHTAADTMVESNTGSRLGHAAAQAAEAAALPSYAEMRQRRTASAWPDVGGPLAATGEAATAGAKTGGNGHDLYIRSMLAASRAIDHEQPSAPYSRAVPAPLSAPNPAAAVAAVLSGELDSLQQPVHMYAPGSWRNADQVAPVISAHSRGPAALLAPELTAEVQRSAAVPGLHDAGWGLGEGLPRAAVSGVFSAAGVAEPVELPPRPRVLMQQLAGNVSLLDHLKAAKAAAASGVK